MQRSLRTAFSLYKPQNSSCKMVHIFTSILLGLLLLATGTRAQFQFFEQMFGGGQQQQQHDSREQNVPSDSDWYQRTYDNGISHLVYTYEFILFYFLDQNANRDVCSARCSNYLCPGTLACVAVPHHCPCQHPAVEDKFELGDGSAICVSKGGFKFGEAARKVELARKGLL